MYELIKGSGPQNELFGCDTMVALPKATAAGHTLFAKNSDRRSEESQPLTQVERSEHKPGSVVSCDFTEIPQIPVTYRHVGSRPFWCWGYEHGFNEHQVAIGNEALRSISPRGKVPRLTGMDLVRLGLERGQCAAESVEVITTLISKFGQGHFVGNSQDSDYDNGFIVADPKEAYIIETAGHEWAVKQVDQTIGISNIHSIETDWVLLSESAEETAIQNGSWEAGSGRFDFKKGYLDVENSWLSSGANRRARSCAFLDDRTGGVDLQTMMNLVSDHSDGTDPYEPHRPTMPSTWSVCVHQPNTPRGGASTAATLIAHLCSDGSRLPVYWCSFYSPCLGIFLPIFSEGVVPNVLGVGGKEASDDSPWWLFRRLERRTRIGLDYDPDMVDAIRDEWKPLQQEFVKSAYEIASQAHKFVQEGEFREATKLTTTYMDSNTEKVLNKVRQVLSQTTPTTLATSD